MCCVYVGRQPLWPARPRALRVEREHAALPSARVDQRRDCADSCRHASLLGTHSLPPCLGMGSKQTWAAGLQRLARQDRAERGKRPKRPGQAQGRPYHQRRWEQLHCRQPKRGRLAVGGDLLRFQAEDAGPGAGRPARGELEGGAHEQSPPAASLPQRRPTLADAADHGVHCENRLPGHRRGAEALRAGPDHGPGQDGKEVALVNCCRKTEGDHRAAGAGGRGHRRPRGGGARLAKRHDRNPGRHRDAGARDPADQSRGLLTEPKPGQLRGAAEAHPPSDFGCHCAGSAAERQREPAHRAERGGSAGREELRQGDRRDQGRAGRQPQDADDAP
mmetsp:Transcript_52373/g.145129  ORF Transcript_52373/g.145129 Transcript_52373/m.145129 type:complete len:333 (+) Transcript_52373:159-1157(+)